MSEAPHGRNLSLRVSVILGVDEIIAGIAVHGERGGDGDGRNAGNRGNFASHFFKGADDSLVFFDLIIGNTDAECLQLSGLREAGVNVSKGAERADHEARADEKNQGESDLHNHKSAARAVLFATAAVGAAAFANAGAEADAGVLENRNAAEEDAGENRD